MSESALSIAQAAQELRVSTRTIRRFIKAGKIKADLVNGTFGPEYRIPEIPAELRKIPPEPEKDEDLTPVVRVSAGTEVVIPANAENPDRILTMLKDLQEMNMALAAQLGAATERIRSLEIQVKQINAPVNIQTPAATSVKKSWWRRLFGFR
jgi:MerR family copper efflux transcriptional regulator